MEFAETITATDFIWLAGLTLFACWLLDTSLGTKSLADSRPRRNSMPPYLPLVPLLLWFGGAAMAVILVQKLTPGLQDWQKIFRDHLVMSIGAVVTIAIMMYLAHVHFARGLKGFGLNIKAIPDACLFVLSVIITRGGVLLLLGRVDFIQRMKDFGLIFVNLTATTVSIGMVILLARVLFPQHFKNIKDFLYACVNLLVVWPLMMAAITLTSFVAELIWGADYQMQQHQQLEMITEYPQLPVRIMIVFVAVIIAPLLEEMMFRGFIQTTIRSYLNIKKNAWPAIAVSSVFFAIMHANPGHWPALFILGVCLGYSYEKSGSLLRPIFIHLIFNASSVATALFIET